MLEMTTEQYLAVKHMFAKYDKDNNEKISVKEFASLVRDLGETMSKQEVVDAVKMLDTDNSGSIEFLEFVSYWASDEGY